MVGWSGRPTGGYRELNTASQGTPGGLVIPALLPRPSVQRTFSIGGTASEMRLQLVLRFLTPSTCNVAMETERK